MIVLKPGATLLTMIMLTTGAALLTMLYLPGVDRPTMIILTGCRSTYYDHAYQVPHYLLCFEQRRSALTGNGPLFWVVFTFESKRRQEDS